MDAIADLTTKDLVKRALAQGKHQYSSSVSSMSGTEPKGRRKSQRVSATRPMSPKTLFLPPQFSSASLVLDSSMSANTSSHAAAAAAIVGAGTADSAGTRRTKKTAAQPPPSPRGCPSLSSNTNNQVGCEPLDAEGGGGRENGEGAQGKLPKTTTLASVDAADAVVTAKRGSWSRPIGPRPQIGKGGSSGGASGGARSDEGNSGDNGMRNSNSSVNASSGPPKNSSKRKVAVGVDGDRVVESEEQQGHEAIANGREGNRSVKGRSIVVERGNTTDGNSMVDEGGSEVVGGSGGGDLAAECIPNESQVVVDPRVHKVMRDRD